MSDEDIMNNSEKSSPRDRGYISLESCNSSDLCSSNSDSDNYFELHRETLSTQQLTLSSESEEGIEGHLNIGNLHILEDTDTLEAAGDCAMVEEARGIRQEQYNPPRFPVPPEVSSESSGYLGSNESSNDTTAERDDESLPQVEFPVRINSSSTSSSLTESSVHSDDAGIDTHRYMRSIVESALQNSFNRARPEKRKKLTKHLNQASGVSTGPDSSESDDSFFSTEKYSSLSSDSSHLYKMTMSVRYPYELTLKKSKSLDSFTYGPCKPYHFLKNEFLNGDNAHSEIEQRQLLKEEMNKFFKEDIKDRSKDLLRNLNALYPRNVQNINFDTYVNTTNYTSTKSDKASKASQNKGNAENETTTMQEVDNKAAYRNTSLILEDDPSYEDIELAKWYTLQTGGPLNSDPLTNLYEPINNRLLRAPAANDGVFEANTADEINETVGFVLANHIRNRVAAGNEEIMAAEGNTNTSILKYNSSCKDKKDTSSLFYVGESNKYYTPEPDEFDESESGKESSHNYKYDPKHADENNNYVVKRNQQMKEKFYGHERECQQNSKLNFVYDLQLSHTSSQESLEYETSSKFQFTKDISGREESLRQSLGAFDFEGEDVDKFNTSNKDDTPKRRVSFNNSYPVYLPSRRSYLKNRHDYCMKNEMRNISSKSTMDAASSTDFLSSTDEEFIKIRTELAGQVKVIDDAEKGSYKLLCDLQALWMNVSNTPSTPSILPNSKTGDHALLQQIHLCSFVTDQMDQDWRAFMSANPIDMKKLHKLQHANKFLKEQLDSCRIIQNCLESEINYAAKEKALLNDEVKHLSYKLATKACKLERAPFSPTTEVYYQRPSILKNREDIQVGYVHQNLITTTSDDIATPGITLNDSANNNATNSIPNQEIKQTERNFVKKREDDFESIMDCVRDRKSVMDTLNTQLDKYQEDVKALQQQIETTNQDKEQVLCSYETLIEEKRALVRERDHYESVLKLLLKEKSNSEFSLQDLLENLMTKLNVMTNEKEGKTSRFSLMESALQAVQNQNLTYREEIIQLKEKMAHDADHSLCLKLELEDSLQNANETVEKLQKVIQRKDEIQKSQEEKLATLEELQNAVTHVKSDLDNAVAGKDEEILTLKKNLEEIHALNVKQQRKIHDLQKVNCKLTRETKEHRRSIEQLGSIINQLRQSISNQKSQYTERVESVSEEVIQSKEHCRWLQLQIDHLNGQLADAHERIKAHEKDKTCLAQQVLSAEEERKVVDRKLNELKSALQSDTVLRQALIERNEALQTEIHRLRRAKLVVNVSPVNERMPNLEGEFANPPSDFSTTEGLSSLNSFPLSDHKPMPVGERRKNRYSTSANRKGTDSPTPRIAVSLHNATGLNCHEITTNLDVDLNAGGAADAFTCSP